MRLLQNLVENRRKLVDERTALSNRLTDLLKLYFPQILWWFNDVASPVVGDLLEQWRSLQDLQQVQPAKLEKFLRDHHCSEIPERLTQIRQAMAATHDRALLDSAPYLVAAWVRQMVVLRKSIRHPAAGKAHRRAGSPTTRLAHFPIPTRRRCGSGAPSDGRPGNSARSLFLGRRPAML